MIGALAAFAASAEPPRAEVLAGWSGGAEHSYGFATVQPALLRSEDRSFVARVTVSRLRYGYLDGDERVEVDSPGVWAGPAYVTTPGDLALGIGAGVGARRSTARTGTTSSTVTKLDASVTGDVFFRPDQRAQLYALLSVAAADRYVWARVGASHPVLPFVARSAPVSLWLGLEGTTSGPVTDLTTGVGPALEVPIRDLSGVVSVRASVPLDALSQLGRVLVPRGTSFGVGAYWAY